MTGANGADGGDRVGIVVLTHDRREELLRSLAQLVALPEQPRIVVVDNASTDGTAPAVRARFPAVELVRLRENRGAAARNVGAARVASPYVAFSDDDTCWEPGALAAAADLLDRHPRLAIVTGRVLIGTQEREDPACSEMAQSPLARAPDLPGVPVLGFMAGATVARRSAFMLAGGFEKRLFIGGEEQLLAVDLAAMGWALAYVPDVLTHHYPSRHRNSAQRRVLLMRNALWFAWLRRPAPVAADLTARACRAMRWSGVARRAVPRALSGLPWALARRRVVPDPIEAELLKLSARDLPA